MNVDYLIVGAGISGASAAYELSRYGSVAIVEAEDSAGYHSTGRSAALYTPNYGPDLVRRINRLSHGFLESPPAGFGAPKLLSPRGMLTVIPADDVQGAAPLLAAGGNDVVALDASETLAMVPFLREDNVVAGVYEKAVADMDVHALHQGFLRGARQQGTVLMTGKRVTAMRRTSEGWIVQAGDLSLNARVVVNAAGAWADELARLAGAAPVGLVPKRRTAILVDMPEGVAAATLPAIDFSGVENYIKPDAGQLMVSPGDATPVEPQDIQPDDMDVAVLVDWLERTTRIEVKRLSHQWAGLRTFADDGNPVVGFDPSVDDFFWLAGQGGYGIMMAPALARAAASLVVEQRLPDDFIAADIDEASLSAQRSSIRAS